MAKLTEKTSKSLVGAEYVTHTTVGHKDHDVTFKKLPMYSFPKGEKRTMKGIVDKGPFIKDVTYFGPGPAAYPQEDEKQQRKCCKSLYPKDQSFKYTMGARRCIENRHINPGPAAYPILNADKANYYNDKLPINGLSIPKKTNQYSFGLARKPIKSTINTEPALYPSIGRSIMLKEEKNKFTFPGRPQAFKARFETPGANLYPLFEREKMNSIHPNETRLKPTMRPPFKDMFKPNSPPPNTYPRERVRTNNKDIYKTMTPGPSAPAYSIRNLLH